MGKVRSKKWRAKHRPQPTGLPSVKETEQQQALEGSAVQEGAVSSLLEKVSRKHYLKLEVTCLYLGSCIGRTVRVCSIGMKLIPMASNISLSLQSRDLAGHPTLNKKDVG